MKNIGILAFYINIGNIAPEEADDYISATSAEVQPDDRTDENIALNYWDMLFIPVRTGESRVQVIRNDGQGSNDEIVLSELKDKLEKIEKLHFYEKSEPEPPLNVLYTEPMSDREELNPYDYDGSK